MAKKRKQKHEEEEGGEAWLLPYSDLMTLLLAVFIVLFAVSKVDQSKAEELAIVFQEGMMSGSEGIFSEGGDSILSPITDETGEGAQEQESSATNHSEETTASGENESLSQEELDSYLSAYELANLEEIKQQLDTMFAEEGMSTVISTNIDTRGLVISLSNAILFDSGSAEIKPENESTLMHIGKIINTLDYYIRIEGHTDNVPINSTVYPSNWELSTARASSVVRLFVDQCSVSPEKVVAVGYGEYKPIADNSTDEGRAKNRRIDIIILSEKYNNLEQVITN